MASRKLENYLKTYRKRSGLSQDEVAFLLGCQSGAKVSRYEKRARRPSLETALAYEAIFGVPARELFAGAFERAAQATLERARVLATKLKVRKPSRMLARKLEALRAAAPETTEHSTPS